MPRFAPLAVVFALAAACGEAPPPPPPVRPPPPMEQDVDDGVMIDTMGSLSGDEVRRTFQGVSSRLVGCYQQGLGRIRALAGDVEFHVRVDREGNVMWVYLPRSGLGDHAAQGCMLDVVRGTRFPRPRGGEAEARFPIELDPPDAVSFPATWTPNQVSEAVAANRGGASECLGGTTGYTLTLYLGPGGVVQAAGATPPDADHQAQADCLAAAAAAWVFPDPGPGGAKVTLGY
jgi:hypothetical protein